MIRLYLNESLSSIRRTNNIFWASALLMIFLLSIFINPDKVTFLSCLFRETTGQPCPTCGLSHSFYAISHLRLWDSVQYHLMGPIIFLSLIFIFSKFALEIITGKEIQIRVNPLVIRIFLIVFVCLWIGFWIIRLCNEL